LPPTLQADIFKDPQVAATIAADSVMLNLEGGPQTQRVTINGEASQSNRIWMEQCFGKEEAQRIGNETVVCSGQAATCTS
jgi:hypothetical protein